MARVGKKPESLCITGGTVKWHNNCEDKLGNFSKKSDIELPCN
jgi:hypothetical protein